MVQFDQSTGFSLYSNRNPTMSRNISAWFSCKDINFVDNPENLKQYSFSSSNIFRQLNRLKPELKYLNPKIAG